MEKRVMVAVNGTRFVGRVINVSEKDYKILINEQNELIAKQEREKAELLETIKSLKESIKSLKNDISVLKGEENDEENI